MYSYESLWDKEINYTPACRYTGRVKGGTKKLYNVSCADHVEMGEENKEP